MKKTLLAVSVLSSMFMAGAANAAFVEATDGAFSGEIVFNGVITDTNPVWMWEIPEASVTAVADWSADVNTGTVDGLNTSYGYASKGTIALIQGYMKTASVAGGAGLTPEIKVGATGAQVVLTNTAATVTVVATGVDASDAAVADGTMSLDAVAFLGGAYGTVGAIDGATVPTYFGDAEAQTIVALQEGFATTYANAATAVTGDYAEATTLLASSASANISGAYKADINNFKLTFPTATLPAKWSAVVPVTVTLK